MAQPIDEEITQENLDQSEIQEQAKETVKMNIPINFDEYDSDLELSEYINDEERYQLENLQYSIQELVDTMRKEIQES